MAEDPTEMLVVDPESSPPPPPPTAAVGEVDKTPRVAMSLLLVAALIGGLLGGGIVALANRHNDNGTNVTFAPGTNLKVRGKALDMQGVLRKPSPRSSPSRPTASCAKTASSARRCHACAVPAPAWC